MTTPSLDLSERTGWPPDLRVLLDTYPRDEWDRHPNLGPLARFWLSIHNSFREGSREIEALGEAFRNEKINAVTYGAQLAPRLQHFLSSLHHHHMIEDHQYFPVFTAAEARLVRGFEVLEADHETIHDRVGAVITAANGLLGPISEGGDDRDAILRAADAYAETADGLMVGLRQHLADEEDLIIPLILDRTESALGLG